MKLKYILSLAMLIVANGYADEPAFVKSYTDASLNWSSCPSFIPEGCEISVLHGDPAEENLDIFFKIPADFTVPHHKHTSQERMVLVSGTLDVTYDNQETVTINEGEYAFGPAERPHTAYCHEGKECVLYIGFVAPLDAIPIEETED